MEKADSDRGPLFLYSMHTLPAWIGDDPLCADSPFFENGLDLRLYLLSILRLDKSNDGWSCAG